MFMNLNATQFKLTTELSTDTVSATEHYAVYKLSTN